MTLHKNETESLRPESRSGGRQGNEHEESMPTTIFTWGYYGWGNHTPKLVEAIDAAERSRGLQVATVR
jgi:hypothetical protein